ncbi:MAG: YihA family ribosome biogenesis GTP-binding protein [Hyphomicrobiales bacterium]|nr:YihA family ribosome biogenesis GTP-binding protein [Hyphomicrobiales bacterium]PCJ87819.1 MAG: YihA family ribosome biogenesis GTP-binding protein [Hyphomicrobiales bacterium]
MNEIDSQDDVEKVETWQDFQEPGRLAFARPWRFVLGVVKTAQLPDNEGREIAFAGRSNVGKSSLINALTGQKGLARTSNTPGRTQELNFFTNDDVTIVDMPGYGYARAPREQVQTWTKLIHSYLRGRVILRRAYVLIDSRHGIKDTDTQVLDLMDKSAVSYQIVMTKIDKPKPAELEASLEKTRAAIAKRPAAHPEILLTSSEKGIGLERLRAEIIRL